jgi:hypothetical protein
MFIKERDYPRLLVLTLIFARARTDVLGETAEATVEATTFAAVIETAGRGTEVETLLPMTRDAFAFVWLVTSVFDVRRRGIC